MGHYDEQYEEMYEEIYSRQRKAKIEKMKKSIDSLYKQGYTETQIKDFVGVCEAFNVNIQNDMKSYV